MSIKIKKGHAGRFRKYLGLSEDEPITMGMVGKALESPKKTVRAMANFARNAKGFKHG